MMRIIKLTRMGNSLINADQIFDSAQRRFEFDFVLTNRTSAPHRHCRMNCTREILIMRNGIPQLRTHVLN
jgi:hypothetical protein